MMNGVTNSRQSILPPSCKVRNDVIRGGWHSRCKTAKGDPQHFHASEKTIEDGGFVVYSEDFLDVLGDKPTIKCILKNDDYPQFHEAGVYIPETGEVFVTSNQFKVGGKKQIQISRLWKDDDAGKWKNETLRHSIRLANGAVNYKDGILFCEQGTFSECGGLTYMSARPPYSTEPILTSYHGRWFNSVNDVVVHSDGSIWFTDPQYGFEQHIRPRPQLPNQVYRFDPKSGDVRAVAQGIAMPNGLCFSPDEQTMYITDTDGIHGEGEYDPSRGSSIFAYDVEYRSGAPFLVNKRLFAFVDIGVPDGIKCDKAGNVYSGCGDGVRVWSPAAELIGKIYLSSGSCANFCFGKKGELFLLNEHCVWHVQLSKRVKGALLGI